MRNCLINGLVCILAIAGTKVNAESCEATYDPATLEVSFPCVRVGTTSSVFDVVLTQTDGWNFALTAVRELNLAQAQVSDVQVLTSPFPVVLAFVDLPDSCTQVYEPAEVVVDNDARSISIDIKATLPDAGQICLTQLSTEIRAFGFESLSFAPGGTTYTVDVNGVTRTFVYDPL